MKVYKVQFIPCGNNPKELRSNRELTMATQNYSTGRQNCHRPRVLRAGVAASDQQPHHRIFSVMIQRGAAAAGTTDNV
jgi:hypothetical protein